MKELLLTNEENGYVRKALTEFAKNCEAKRRGLEGRGDAVSMARAQFHRAECVALDLVRTLERR